MSSALHESPAILPDIAVVIVTYNSVDVIGDLLDSLPKALDGLSADVVVVDNGSSDGTAELVAVLGACRIVRSANVGYAGGINKGIERVSGVLTPTRLMILVCLLIYSIGFADIGAAWRFLFTIDWAR